MVSITSRIEIPYKIIKTIPYNIFRRGSKPKSLQTHRHHFGNTANHLLNKSTNVTLSENRFFCFFTKVVAPQANPHDDGDGDDDGDEGRIFPEHPSPIIHAPRDIISRKGKSLTPIIGICIGILLLIIVMWFSGKRATC